MQTPAFQHTTCSLTPSASTAETCSAFLRPPHLQQVLQWVRSKRNWFCSGRAEGTRVLPWSEQSNERLGAPVKETAVFFPSPPLLSKKAESLQFLDEAHRDLIPSASRRGFEGRTPEREHRALPGTERRGRWGRPGRRSPLTPPPARRQRRRLPPTGRPGGPGRS